MSVLDESPPTYEIYFGFGHVVRLLDRPDVFRVSLAGIALGAWLVKNLTPAELRGSFLDLGTGSGVQALLLRKLGAEMITATDIDSTSVMLAPECEALNFGDDRIRFIESDLFEALDPGARFDTIVFNPPGWRAPSEGFVRTLQHRNDGANELALNAMFYGDSVILRFLNDLPAYLNEGGRAVIGLNSLVGIQDIIQRYQSQWNGAPPLKFRLIERHTLPLLLYTRQWMQVADALKEEFACWRKAGKAAYEEDSEGRIYWSYEVIECVFPGYERT